VRVAVVGARGQLGAAVVHELSQPYDVTPLTHADLDINDAAAVDALLSNIAPDVIVNCAGYNAVDAAEDEAEAALQTNAIAVRSLARAAGARGAALVHFSSDFVFDGVSDRPYTEEDRPNPRSVYAASKLIGEWFAADAPRAYVLRVESLFGRAPAGPAKGSAEAILAALRGGTVARVFEDRTVSPTYVLDAARALRELLDRRAPAGLYHCVNSGHCTWVEFAEEAARLIGVKPLLEKIRMADVPMRAARPHYCALSNAKLAAAGILMPPWQDALARYLEAARHDLTHELSNR
jgi:dTDP-4-dehydrorhamnose reductase